MSQTQANQFNKFSQKLTTQIMVGLFSGFALGIIFNLMGNPAWISDYLVNGLFHVIGKVFVASLKLLVVPLVLVSLVCGTAALDDIRKLGRVGGKTLGLYLFTTAVAITLGLIVANLVQPGEGFDLKSAANFQAKEAPSLAQTLIEIFPTNPFQAMADGKMLQIIVFALLFGVAISLSGKQGQKVLDGFKALNEVVMKMVLMMMAVAPVGVFCLIAKVFAEQGFDAIVPLAKYFFVVLFVLLLHGFVTYPILLRTLSGLSPVQFFRRFRAAPIFAFSTASSNATLPITLETVEHKLGVKNSIASFTIPLGATINMDGTAIMQGVATVFIAQAYSIDISMGGYLMVVVTATLASIGTAGVPGVGLIMLAMVLRQVGLPVEGIGIIIGVDRLLDMVRTAVNITGDATVTCIVAKSEKQFSSEIFNART